MGEFRQSTLRDDLFGGLVSVSLAIPLAMGYGMFAFTALGDSYFAHGALAGLYAAIVAGVVCVGLGDRTTTVYAPRVTTTFLLGALLYDLVHSDAEVLRGGNVHLIVIAFFSIIFLGGVFQALFGLARLGSLIRFAPHPVMAGLQNAAAALLFLVQLGDVCGFDHNIPFKAVLGHLAEVKPLSLAVALVTFVVMWKARVNTTKIPPLLVGLGIGTVLYFVLVLTGFGAQLGPVIGVPVAVESPTPYRAISDQIHLGDFAELFPFIVGGAFALALVAAIDALLCAKLVTPAGAKKADGNRLLMRLGIGNVLSACVGGITSGINIGPSLANRAFGAKTSLSVLINVTVLLLMSSVLSPVVSYIPRVVLSATIMVIAVQHIDPWSIDLVRRISTSASRHRGLMLLDLLVVAVVTALSVIINIVTAVFLGIVIAIALFIVRMSRSNIRRRYNCDKIHSRKARTPEEAALLEKRGGDILGLELQGVLFFGSAEMLSDDIERASAAGLRTIILDLRRVTEIDATGARILADIQVSLARKNQHLVLALAKNSETAARLSEAGIIEAMGAGCLFEDIDRAMEWAEDELIRTDAKDTKSNEIPLASVDLLSTLTSAELEAIEHHTRRETFPRGKVIFREGDPGSELFIVTKGRTSAYLNLINGGDIRLATFAPGTIFGELAILDTGPRSASVVADDDVICYVLSEQQFAALAKDAPAVAIKLLSGLGRELSRRLRRANQTIHQLET
ncbi:SulP family inorganic anion transporter [Bradyrhizobium sp. Ash2021]|uniref:SulP family inorganic anion transporter n=1 Tax=Bradyrhizobium sp. Ash2021 TaxID=2954771 RepID=UPI0028162783|nr:SulP family inorganic anion transporter [Bradyrhizobium sp. Ash2021]WMT72856.1 SulP family inorganic anion transporter [Bradyrhizobium sp. Ash2021]